MSKSDSGGTSGMKRVLRGRMIVLAMVLIITALKFFLPDIAVVVGAIAALVGLVEIFRPLPGIGLNSRVMAGALVLIIGPMGFLDPKTQVAGDGTEVPAESQHRRRSDERKKSGFDAKLPFKSAKNGWKRRRASALVIVDGATQSLLTFGAERSSSES